MHHNAKFGADRSNSCGDMSFLIFQDGSRPPSWICCTPAWTTHYAQLVVFIAVQNVVGIDIVVLKICDFQCYASFAGKCLFMSFLGCFWVKMGKKKLFAVLSLCGCNILGLTSYESNCVKIASAVQSMDASKNWGHQKQKENLKN